MAAIPEETISDSWRDANEATRELSEILVRRAISYVQSQLPHLADALGLAACGPATRLTYSHGEPAINVYTGAGGAFFPHQDMQALTLLLPLSDAGEEFDGGGTAFWPPGASLPAAKKGTQPPVAVLRPPAGTALLWSGTLVHAGAELTRGRRLVFVASFTPVEGATALRVQ